MSDKLEITVVYSAPPVERGPALRCVMRILRRMGFPLARLAGRVRRWPLD